jgi:hypothetical protein
VSPRTVYLPLLPSGPGGVRSVLPHRTQRLTKRCKHTNCAPTNEAEREGFEPSNPFRLRAFQARALGQTMRPLQIHVNYTVHQRSGQAEEEAGKNDSKWKRILCHAWRAGRGTAPKSRYVVCRRVETGRYRSRKVGRFLSSQRPYVLVRSSGLVGHGLPVGKDVVGGQGRREDILDGFRWKGFKVKEVQG